MQTLYNPMRSLTSKWCILFSFFLFHFTD